MHASKNTPETFPIFETLHQQRDTINNVFAQLSSIALALSTQVASNEMSQYDRYSSVNTYERNHTTIVPIETYSIFAPETPDRQTKSRINETIMNLTEGAINDSLSTENIAVDSGDIHEIVLSPNKIIPDSPQHKQCYDHTYILDTIKRVRQQRHNSNIQSIILNSNQLCDQHGLKGDQINGTAMTQPNNLFNDTMQAYITPGVYYEKLKNEREKVAVGATVMAHEIGHLFALGHSSSVLCQYPPQLIGNKLKKSDKIGCFWDNSRIPLMRSDAVYSNDDIEHLRPIYTTLERSIIEQRLTKNPTIHIKRLNPDHPYGSYPLDDKHIVALPLKNSYSMMKNLEVTDASLFFTNHKDFDREMTTSIIHNTYNQSRMSYTITKTIDTTTGIEYDPKVSQRYTVSYIDAELDIVALTVTADNGTKQLRIVPYNNREEFDTLMRDNPPLPHTIIRTNSQGVRYIAGYSGHDYSKPDEIVVHSGPAVSYEKDEKGNEISRIIPENKISDYVKGKYTP